VYVARDSVEAAAAAGLLEAEGIETRLRDMGVSLYPVTFGPLGEKRIAVRARDAAQARSLCRRAVEDGFLPEGMVKEERRS
jgi:hypothetical protein